MTIYEFLKSGNICFAETEDTSDFVHRFGYSRGVLPHLSYLNGLFFVTTRLYDSVPQSVVDDMCRDLGLFDDDVLIEGNSSVKNQALIELWNRIQQYEDAGHGCCFLQNPEVATIVFDALKFYEGKDYELLAWSIMPNHIHILLHLTECYLNALDAERPLAKIMQKIKGYSAYKSNQLLGRTGQPFWQKEYFDRYIRDEKHLRNCVKYIINNPRKAGIFSPYTGTIFDEYL